MTKLFSYYSIDECNNRDRLFEKLDFLKDEGKIEYKMKERDVFSIEDIELEDKEIDKLVEEFDNMEVYSYLDYDDLDSSNDWGDDFIEEDEY